MTNAMANLGTQASGIRSLGSAMNGAGRSGNGFFGTIKKGISSINVLYGIFLIREWIDQSTANKKKEMINEA